MQLQKIGSLESSERKRNYPLPASMVLLTMLGKLFR